MTLNEEKIELSYNPRKCSFSNQILTSKDHSSIQISIQPLNLSGVAPGKNKTFAINGKIRRKGISDLALNLLTEEQDLIQKNFN
mmetsp:Transcript_10314/g.26732  ORF Transcript_10314/g.26732 Transcript_10314/m.26732 type:complete len:84 (-) Transcript_10314:92-343(-)